MLSSCYDGIMISMTTSAVTVWESHWRRMEQTVGALNYRLRHFHVMISTITWQ